MGSFKIIRSDPPLKAYISKPAGDGPFPVVIVFMHRPGVDDSQQKVVENLASAGFIGVCQDAYRDDTIKDSYTDATIFEDYEYTVSYIRENISKVDSEKLAIVGFCMGGRHVFLAASRYSKLKSAVSYYGFPGSGNNDKDTPIKVIDKMNVPVLGIFGKQDHLFPFSDVESFRDKLLASSDKHKIVVYDDVGHGFLNPNSPRFGDGVSAGKAWMETISFIKKNFEL